MVSLAFVALDADADDALLLRVEVALLEVGARRPGASRRPVHEVLAFDFLAHDSFPGVSRRQSQGSLRPWRKLVLSRASSPSSISSCSMSAGSSCSTRQALDGGRRLRLSIDSSEHVDPVRTACSRRQRVSVTGITVGVGNDRPVEKRGDRPELRVRRQGAARPHADAEPRQTVLRRNGRSH